MSELITENKYNEHTQLKSKLAIDGGTPTRTRPFPPWPYFEADEIEVVTEVLKSGKVNYWTGNHGKQFEKEFAEATQTPYAIAVSNGTVALELALYTFGIMPGDEVITTPRTFIASASAVVMRGATPIFADIDRNSQNITAQTIEKVLTPRTKAIIAVHLGGFPCDMDPIMDLARKHNIIVIEDCAQAQGAHYKGHPIGSLGHAAAFSFCQDKILTTAGEGGMLTLKDKSLWEKAWSFKDHGKSFDAVFFKNHNSSFKWLHESFGTNWRLTEMQSAIGRILLKKLPERLAKRRLLASHLDRIFKKWPPFRMTQVSADFEHAYYKYYTFLKKEFLQEGWDKERLIRAISAEGVPCLYGSCSEIYLEKAFSGAIKPSSRLPVAMELAETALMFLVHPTITEEDLLDYEKAINKVMKVASRV